MSDPSPDNQNIRNDFADLLHVRDNWPPDHIAAFVRHLRKIYRSRYVDNERNTWDYALAMHVGLYEPGDYHAAMEFVNRNWARVGTNGIIE